MPVDLGDRGGADPDPRAPLQHQRQAARARRRQHLGIGKPFERTQQDHGGGDDGAGERAAPDLVDPRDQPATVAGARAPSMVSGSRSRR